MNGSAVSSRRAIRVVAAMVSRPDGRYLITQRRREAVLPLLWEFPGGRVEAGESDQAALRRELAHRLGVGVEVGELVSFVRHDYQRYALDLYLYSCQLEPPAPQPVHVNAMAWAHSSEFENYEFTPADERSVAALLGL